MPCFFNMDAHRVDEGCRMCGDPMAPALSTTSRAALTDTSSPLRTISAPVQRSAPLLSRSILSFFTRELVHVVRFDRCLIGRRKAFEVFQRQPSFCVTLK